MNYVFSFACYKMCKVSCHRTTQNGAGPLHTLGHFSELQIMLWQVVKVSNSDRAVQQDRDCEEMNVVEIENFLYWFIKVFWILFSLRSKLEIIYWIVLKYLIFALCTSSDNSKREGRLIFKTSTLMLQTKLSKQCVLSIIMQ